jgi:DNA-binding response OmpR family regulator
MLKNQNEQVTVLGLCVEEPAQLGRTPGLDFCTVRSGNRAIEMLRMLSFDLMIVGMKIPDINTWDFVRRVRTGWAWQKWALVGGGTLTEEQEITARTFGSIRIFDLMPASDEVLQMALHLRRKTTVPMLNQPGEGGYRSAASF